MRGRLHRAQRVGIVEVAPAAALPVPGRRGHYSAVAARQKSNAVFFTSRGELTAYSSAGDLLWQVFTGVDWPPAAQVGGEDADGEESADAEQGAAPTLVPLSLRRHAIPSAILAAGPDEVTVVSEHGHELESFALPAPPVQPLAAVDFDLDGYTDVILTTADGMYAWAQVRKPGAVPFSALVGGLVVTMLAVFVTQQGFMKQAGKPKGRSTDRID